MGFILLIISISLAFSGLVCGYDVIPSSTIISTSANDFFPADNLMNRNCTGTNTRGWCPADDDSSPGITITFKSASVLKEFRFQHVSSDCRKTALTPGSYVEYITFEYMDLLDSNQMIPYLTPVKALTQDGAEVVTSLVGEIVTDRIVIRPLQFHSKPCLTVEILGLELTVDKIEVHQMDFLRLSHKELSTPYVDFDVTGDVKLLTGSTGRRRTGSHTDPSAEHSAKRFLGHFGWPLLFFKNGGYLKHNFNHQNHFGHHGQRTGPPQWPNSPLGFSTSFHASFGPHHNHNHPFFFHNSNKLSVVYNSQTIHAHVWSGQGYWQVMCPFSPVQGVNYHFVASFHHLLGIRLHIGSSRHCHNNQFTSQYPPPPQNPFNLCVGQCHVAPAQTNLTLQGGAIVGASLNHLIAAGLRGLLGLPATTNASTTTAMTTMTTTTPKPPKTATTATTQATSTGPICYNCASQPKDGACTAVTKCRTGEVCTVYSDSTGFTHKCLPKMVCDVSKKLSSSPCFNCCPGNFCNANCPAEPVIKRQECRTMVHCVDAHDCSVLSSTGYNVCGDVRVAHSICNKTCHTC